jgi:hypothetical protein
MMNLPGDGRSHNGKYSNFSVTVNRLSKNCGSLDSSQRHGLPLSVSGTALHCISEALNGKYEVHLLFKSNDMTSGRNC